MYSHTSFNYTWTIIAIIVIGNMWFFIQLSQNVNAYAEKMSSTVANKYELEDI